MVREFYMCNRQEANTVMRKLLSFCFYWKFQPWKNFKCNYCWATNECSSLYGSCCQNKRRIVIWNRRQRKRGTKKGILIGNYWNHMKWGNEKILALCTGRPHASFAAKQLFFCILIALLLFFLFLICRLLPTMFSYCYIFYILLW